MERWLFRFWNYICNFNLNFLSGILCFLCFSGQQPNWREPKGYTESLSIKNLATRPDAFSRKADQLIENKLRLSIQIAFKLTYEAPFKA